MPLFVAIRQPYIKEWNAWIRVPVVRLWAASMIIFAVFRGGAARINGREARAERQVEFACQTGMTNGF